MIDHRSLGRELELFGSDPLIGAGLPYWLPAGVAVRSSIEDYLRRVERRAGYQHVYSPVLARRQLFELSGHWAHYRDDMFPPMPDGGEDSELVLRPSLCPGHALIYRSHPRSYRDLPVRLAELGPMFRAEASGVLGGLTRVRAIQLNDAHIFARHEQVADEVHAVLNLIEEAYGALGIRAHRFRLSLRGHSAKYVDDPGMWDLGEQALARVLVERGLDHDSVPGEGAFYGPKIDIQIVDPSGRESTLSTVQLDYFQPERFGLGYVGRDQVVRRPVMIHHSIVGSLERLVAHLIEVHEGVFPTWLAPCQVAILPVGDEQMHAAASLHGRLIELDVRASVVAPDRGTLGGRIRAHRRVPYLAVVGDREVADNLVSLRLRDGSRLDQHPPQAAIERIIEVISRRAHNP
ncbi:threonine--tRNA ligase [Pseudonocardia spinosispora]|uniref:threonine--tRNA ligase n=1 Tax=Pseudonocardia spinosispora TaxID=103441 RepID=UPI00041125DF|nr:threonine--tRNA ligase [Pseudonocardia spinosispora]